MPSAFKTCCLDSQGSSVLYVAPPPVRHRHIHLTPSVCPLNPRPPPSTRQTCLLPPEHTSHLSSLNCLAKAVLCSPTTYLGLHLVHEGPLTTPSRCTFFLPQNSGNIVIHLILLFPTSFDSLIILLDQFLCLTQDASRFCFSQMLNIIKLFIRSD